MRRLPPSVVATYAYGYALMPLLLAPVHAVFLPAPCAVLALNAIFSSVLLSIPLLTPLPNIVKKLTYGLLNTLALVVALGVLLTGDLPSPMALASAVHTDAGEALSLLNSVRLPAGLLFVSWLLQLVALLTSGAAPTIRFAGKFGRFGNLAFVLLALPAAAPDLSLSYPAAVPGMLQKAISYLSFHNLVPANTVPAVQPITKPSNELMMLVIGESSSADYWQLGGSKEATSPHMVRRQAAGELLYFSKHMSASQVTFLAVPNLLTPFGELQMQSTLAPSPSIVSLMNKAGRRTAWFSTQSPQVASTEATDIDFKEGNFSFLTLNNLDEGLLPDMDKWMTKYSHRPAFLVMHTQGSHIPFELRYPSTFRKWPIAGGSFPTSQDEGNYRNTILYTDSLLERLMERLQQEPRPALLAYVADHGESVMRAGHHVRTSVPLGADVLHVPLIFWANAAWRAAHPDRWAALQLQRNANTHHLNLAPTLMHLAGYSYAGEPNERDLLSPQFSPWLTSPATSPGLPDAAEVPIIK